MYQEATVCHLLRGGGSETEILLGKRESPFCDGVLNGPGGKFNEGETAPECACREVSEEIDVVVNPTSLRHYASADFFHPSGGEYFHKWRVHYFTTTRWRGEPRIRGGFTSLLWFPVRELPFDQMMPDQRFWLLAALPFRENGQMMQVEIFYRDGAPKTVERGSFRLVAKECYQG